MLKHVQRLALLAAMIVLPWLGHGQALSDYTLTTDTTTFTSIATTGTAITLSSTDDGYGTVSMPFAFSFGESSLLSGNNICVGSNGYILLTGTSSSSSISSPTASQRVINAAISADAHMGRYSGAGCFYQLDTVDGVQCFTIEFHLLAAYSTPYGVYSHQIKLYENGNIELVYDSINGSSTMRTYLWDGPTSDLAVITGPWATPTYGTTMNTRPTTDLPAHGLRYTLTRPVISCPKVNALDVTSVSIDEATLTWYDTVATGWTIEFDTVTFTPGAGLASTATTTMPTYTMTGLNPNTTYFVYVRADCDGGDTSLYRMVTFTTLAALPASLPFVCDFEDTTMANSGWDVFNGSQTNAWYVGTGANNTVGGSRGLYISNTGGASAGYNNGSTSFTYAVRNVQMDDDGEIAYSFDWKCDGESGYDYIRAWLAPATANLTAGQCPDGTTSSYSYQSSNPTGWIPLDGGSKLNLNASWATRTGTTRLTAGSYKLVFMWANDGSGGSNPAGCIDNVNIVLNTCPQPWGLTCDAVTDSLTITWHPGGSEGEWEMVFDGTASIVTDTVAIFTDLLPNTPHTFSVRGICDMDDTSLVSSATYRTACAPYMIIPYTETFAGMPTSGQVRPSCWVCGGYDPYPYVGAYGGSEALYFYSYYSSGYADYRPYAVMPAVDTTEHPIRTLQVSFDAMKTTSYTYNYYQANLIVGVCSNPMDLTTFVPVDTIENIPYNNNQMTSYEIALSNYNDTGNYIYFQSIGYGSSSFDYAYVAVDNITINPIPTCQRVLDLHTTQVLADSVYLAWTDTNATVDGWYVEYGPAGFQHGDDSSTTVYINDTTLAGIGDLMADSYYDFYVAADCGGGDSGYWRMITVHTACTPIDSLPYFYGFEDATGTDANGQINPCWKKMSYYEPGYPRPNGNACTGNFSLYFYNYGYNGEHQYAAMPMFNHQLDSLQLKFKIKRASTYSYSYYDFGLQVGVMTDPEDLNTFTAITTCQATSSTTWDSFTVYLAAYEGTGRYIAFRDNSNSIGYYTYVYLDDVKVDWAPQCGPVSDIQVQATPTNALVTWTPSNVGVYAGAIVGIEDTATNTWIYDTVTGTNALFTGLTPEQGYNVAIVTTCDEGESQEATSSFVTLTRRCGAMVDGTADTAVMGTGTASTSGVPVNSSWGNTVCQSIYTAAELHAAGCDSGTFNAIDYTWTVNSTYAKEFTIIMGTAPVATTTYASSSDMISPVTHSVVYHGDHVQGTSGTIHYDLEAPFRWNGTDNLVITTFMNQPTGTSHSSSGFYGHSTNCTGNVSVYAYQDGSQYTQATATSAGYHYTSSYRPSVTLYSGECAVLEDCVAPAPIVTEVGTTTATVAWAPGNTETSWNLYYKLHANNNYTYHGTTTNNTYTYTGLQSGTNFDFKVVALCGGDSNSAVCSGTTECAKIDVFPYTENFNSWTAGSGMMPNCWTREGSYSSYPYLYSYYNYGGTGNSLYFYLYNNGTNYCRATMPEVDTTVQPINNLQLYFMAMQTYAGYNNMLEIGVMSDPNNMSTYVPVDTVSLVGRNTSEWYDFEVPLSRYADTGAYITLKALTNSTYTYTYVDDLTVEVIPTCQRPDSLVLDSTTVNSFTCHWRERNGASDWIIEYGPRGFQPGTGVQVAANSNPFTVTGVPSSYVGEFYVYTVCSSSDTSLASRHACLFSTPQIPANIPYSYDFEDSTEFNNWQTNTNNNNVNWYRGSVTSYGTSSYSMYVSADNGATVSTDMSTIINSAIYRDIDFGEVDSSFDITFRYRCGGTTANRYDGLMVFLVDSYQDVVASNTAITSPWGHVNNLYRIANLRCDTNWTYFRGSLDTIHGVHRVAFFWFNQGTGVAGFEYGPCAVDDIQIDYSPCPRPVLLDTTFVSGSSVGLIWQGPAAANYTVCYRVAGAPVSTNQFMNVTTNTATVTGLDPMTTYYFFVRRYNATDTSLWSDGIAATTLMCDGAQIMLSYDSTMTETSSNYAPMGYSFYNYSYTQTLIDSAQLASLTGPIDALAFNPTTTTSGNYFTNMDIYMANVPETSLTGFILPDSTHQFVQLTNGADLSYTETGWQNVGFDSSFVWDGHSSILVAINRRHGSYASGATFSAHTTPNVRTVYAYNDGSAYNINSPTASTAYTLSMVGDLQLISCSAEASCPAPVITGETHDYESVTATWSGTGNTYQVAIKETAATDWPAETTVTGNTYTFTGLLPATNYTFRVRQDCSVDSLGFSEWVMAPVTTDSLPCFAPSTPVASNITNAEASISWTANGEETNWEIHVWALGVSDQNFTVTTNPATVNGLVAGVTYNVAVRALCGSALIEGDWSDTATFTTLTCPDVTGLATSNVTFNSVDLSWNTDPMAHSWIIEYGFAGFNQGQGTTVNVTTNSYTVTGLTDETNYDFYVRAVCGTDWTSENWAHVSATTAQLPEDVVTLTLLVNDPSMGTVSGAGTYAAGTSVTISATPYEGYQFDNWSDGNTEATRTLVIDDNITLTANFSATQVEGIDEVSGASCTIYPNPATSSTTINVAGVNGKVRISVVDMNGRVVATDMLECNADCVKTMDVDNLAQGAYFVRITGENVNMVKKLVVR